MYSIPSGKFPNWAAPEAFFSSTSTFPRRCIFFIFALWFWNHTWTTLTLSPVSLAKASRTYLGNKNNLIGGQIKPGNFVNLVNLVNLALWGNKNGLPSMKVSKLEKFQSKMVLIGCKWSSLNAPGTQSPQSHPYWKLGEFPFPIISPLG